MDRRPGEHGDQDGDGDLAARFSHHGPRLLSLAERLLGSAVEAEDAVQDAWLRLARANGEIENLGGWLTTVTSRLCLDRLRARYARPESPLDDRTLDRPGPEDPAAEAVVADAVGRALVVVLESLSPAERVAVVLHDVFAVPFRDIAPVIGRSVDATTKLTARARRRARLGAETARPELATRRAVVVRFLAAIREGDMGAMLEVLAPDAVRRVDPVLLGPGQHATLRGAAAIVEEARSFSARARGAVPVLVDGDLGAVVERDGRPILALRFAIVRDAIQGVEVIADPHRLDRLTFVVPPP